MELIPSEARLINSSYRSGVTPFTCPYWTSYFSNRSKLEEKATGFNTLKNLRSSSYRINPPTRKRLCKISFRRVSVSSISVFLMAKSRRIPLAYHFNTPRISSLMSKYCSRKRTVSSSAISEILLLDHPSTPFVFTAIKSRTAVSSREFRNSIRFLQESFTCLFSPW